MKIAVLGGGFGGLTAAYYLAKKGHQIVLFEKEAVLGGLAVGFKGEGWDWHLERAVHHLLASDNDIIALAKEVEFDQIFYQATETASLYGEAKNYRIIPMDSPQDLLTFPYLSLPRKIRAGAVLAFLKLSPFLSTYEKYTAQEFLTKTMGKQAWEALWAELFRKKFGEYAGIILASFMWARIKKRSKELGYIKGGFQSFINHLEQEIGKLKVVVKKNTAIRQIIKEGSGFGVITSSQDRFDAVISTLPSPLLPKVANELFSAAYLPRFQKLKFLHAVSLIVETKEPILDRTYWLNVCAKDNEIMGLIQHTNFIDKKHYNGHHLAYAYNYVPFEDPRIRMSDEVVFDWYVPQIKKINPKFHASRSKFYVFKGPFAQPIFDKEFLQNKPDFETPVKNFYIANLDMTYPYDRGTNYAVKLGREVTSFF